jgi:hypothetical protein
VTGSLIVKGLTVSSNFSWADLSLQGSSRDCPPTLRALILKHRRNYRYTGFKEGYYEHIKAMK